MHGTRETLILQRDVDVIYVPDGTSGTLPQGEVVQMYQALGGSYTVIASGSGRMARIAAGDADALGKEPETLDNLSDDTDAASVEKNVWEVLKTIYDPEIPVNIVELGLVYRCEVTPVDDGDGRNDVHVVMTLTAPGCGMGPVLQFDAERAIRQLPGIRQVNVEVVFDPPWSRDMMSEAAKLELGML
ncbi:putative Fe-S cluster assembly protein SufT [Methylogaea oryzae]|uniref:Fe-S cluster assembly protein SufT n=1 Tax=Methylogaea oryzae TaxID=1295382 RepID=A0A8D5AIY2_9GAMM|nr:putative Fe-S cluster assembly protein SufT [Methylogaea oryzae]BBL70214.1 putative Fe-S cluster assembly protein SufT [Methylogaea oryzae]